MQSRKTVTVGLPNYNHARFLPKALDAILSQSRSPDEFIVIDDASTDNSVEILRDYAARDHRLRVIVNEKNRGVVANVNTLLRMARSDYFYPPAADDLIRPGFIEKSMAMLETSPSAALCSTLSENIDVDGAVIGCNNEAPYPGETSAIFLLPEEAQRIMWQRGPWILGNSVILRRALLLEQGGYSAELGPYADGYLYQVLAWKHGACFIPEFLAAWRRMPTSYSAQASRDPVVARNIRDKAERMLLTQCATFIPAAYVARWRRRTDCELAISLVSASARTARRAVRLAIPARSFAYRPLQWATDIGFWLAEILAVGAALLWLRWFDFPRIVRNRLRRKMRRRHPTDLV